jgi:hypothetical protein
MDARVVILRLFLSLSSPRPSAARWSDTEPKVGSEIEIRASVAAFAPFATVTVSAFADSLNALPRTARCLPHQ